MRNTFLNFSSGLALLLLFAGCQSSPTSPSDTPNNTVFTLGDKATVATQAISSAGGRLTVAGTQTKLDGLILTVPDTAYTGSRTFSVSSAPITGSTLSADLVALTPMITISNGGGYATNPMTIQIPITLPTGSFAGAFFYNESTGELEPIPVDAESSTSITISTCHFSTSSLTSRMSGGKGPIIKSGTSFSDIVILAMDENKLFAVGNQVSGFTPGVDDWEFTNYGSYIAPGGHCAGQSMTAMWYYYQQKNVENHALSGYLNTNPNFATYPSANRLGYRFASVVHADMNQAGWRDHVTFQSLSPPMTFKTFLLGFYVSKKQPQSVFMYKAGQDGGHAMVCYGVEYTDKSNGKLRIADPNHPGHVEEINYVNGQFQTYTTGLRADGTPVSFDHFGMTGKTAYVPWDQVGVRWSQLKAKTIGAVAPNTFPHAVLKYLDPDLKQILDMPTSFTINSDTLEVHWDVVGAPEAWIDAYASDGTVIDYQNNKLALQFGKNIIGFFFQGNPKAGGVGHEWVDFIWDTIYSNQLAIDPPTVTGQPGVAYSWTASAGSTPSNARYEWKFGDGTPLVVKTNNGAASHTYSASGSYTITLSLYDNAKNQLLGTATATATIGAPASHIWDTLHSYSSWSFWCGGTFTLSDGSDFTTMQFPMHLPSVIPITWNGTVFTGSFATLGPYAVPYNYDSEICVVTGTLLSDGITIKSLSFSRRFVERYGLDSTVELIDVTLSNAVGVLLPSGRPYYYWTGGDVKPIVSNLNYIQTTRTLDQSTGTFNTTSVKSLTSVDWGANSYFTVSFK